MTDPAVNHHRRLSRRLSRAMRWLRVSAAALSAIAALITAVAGLINVL